VGGRGRRRRKHPCRAAGQNGLNSVSSDLLSMEGVVLGKNRGKRGDVAIGKEATGGKKGLEL